MGIRMRAQAVIIEGARILLVKHRHHPSGREYWVLPGGGVEEGETAEEAAAREVFEELNLRSRVVRLLYTVDNKVTFLMAVEAGIPSLGRDPERRANQVLRDIGWFDRLNISEFDEKTRRQLELVNLSLRAEQPNAFKLPASDIVASG